MKNICKAIFVLFSLLQARNAGAQAFEKGSLTLSVSEGATWSNYTTTSFSAGRDVLTTAHLNGNRDPIFVEYGISDRWGVGLSMGTDIYKIDPDALYNYESSTRRVNALMGEITADVNYHFYVTKHLDLAAFTALGFSGVNFSVSGGDEVYQYKCGGTIVRVGAKAKYYVLKRFGFMGMLSGFNTNCTTTGTPGDPGDQHSNITNIRGIALEFGLCYRILR